MRYLFRSPQGTAIVAKSTRLLEPPAHHPISELVD